MTNPSYNDLFRILDAPTNAEKPWMTAGRIATRWIEQRSANSADPAKLAKTVEAVLLSEYASQVSAAENLEYDPPLIRYSSLPSRRSLEVLWGVTARVGHRGLSNLTKDDAAATLGDQVSGDLSQTDRPSYFFSHSHRDYEPVVDIARQLCSKEIYTWLAETHIERGQTIHHEIIAALHESDGFLLFLSENALRSRWTEKEFMRARNQGKSIHIFADFRSAVIRNLVTSARAGDWAGLAEGELSRWDTESLVRDFVKSSPSIVRWYAYPEVSPELSDVPSYRDFGRR